MKIKNKQPKARVSPEGFMGSASREHRVKKGKGSFRRREKHQISAYERKRLEEGRSP